MDDTLIGVCANSGTRDQSVVATSGLPGTSEFLVWSEGCRLDPSGRQVRTVHASRHQDPEGDRRLAGKRTGYRVLHQKRRLRLRAIQQSGLLCELLLRVTPTHVNRVIYSPQNRLFII